MKNYVPRDEYALFIDALGNQGTSKETPFSATSIAISQSNEVGSAACRYAPLDSLGAQVTELESVDFNIQGHPIPIFSSKQIVSAPMEFVFRIIMT